MKEGPLTNIEGNTVDMGYRETTIQPTIHARVAHFVDQIPDHIDLLIHKQGNEIKLKITDNSPEEYNGTEGTQDGIPTDEV